MTAVVRECLLRDSTETYYLTGGASPPRQGEKENIHTAEAIMVSPIILSLVL